MSDRPLDAELSAAVAGVQPPPGLLPAVREGGARRLRRRRRRTAAVALALVVGAIAVPFALPGQPSADPAPIVDNTVVPPSLNGFAETSLSMWNSHPPLADEAERGFFDDVRGPALLKWVGQTPVGPAALVVQRTYLAGGNNLNPADAGYYTLYGFLGTDAAGRPVLRGSDFQKDGAKRNYGAWWVDDAHTTLAVISNGERYGLSRRWTYFPDGRARRTDWLPVTDVGSGMGLISTTDVPSLLLARAPYVSQEDVVQIDDGLPTPDSSEVAPARPGLPWTEDVRLPGAPAVLTAEDTLRLSRAVLARIEPAYRSVFSSTWSIEGPGFVLGQSALDDDPFRLYALVGDDELLDGGQIDTGAPLPVQLRLPGARGWAVAALGSELRWRRGAGPWMPVRTGGAALLPDGDDLSVEVTRSGADPVVVRLR